MSLDIPDHFKFTVGLDLDVGITSIPKIYIGVDPINIDLAPIDIRLAPIEIKPIDMSFRIKEIPSVRVWFPLDYKVCFALLGSEVASVRLCGQGQVITEPYVPNPCECRPPRLATAVVGRDDVEAVAAAVAA
jgi:hypothetical protein